MRSRQELQLFSSLWYLLLNVNGCTLCADSTCISHALIRTRPQQPGHQGFMATSRLFRRLLLSQRWDISWQFREKDEDKKARVFTFDHKHASSARGSSTGKPERGESVRKAERLKSVRIG